MGNRFRTIQLFLLEKNTLIARKRKEVDPKTLIEVKPPKAFCNWHWFTLVLSKANTFYNLYCILLKTKKKNPYFQIGTKYSVTWHSFPFVPSKIKSKRKKSKKQVKASFEIEKQRFSPWKGGICIQVFVVQQKCKNAGAKSGSTTIKQICGTKIKLKTK